MSLSPSSGQIKAGDEIKLQIDSAGESLESATAVIKFDSSKVEFETESGGFFPITSADTSVDGERTITGNVNFGDQVGKTGSGTISVLTITPLIDSGSFSLEFECMGADSEVSDDSNIYSIGGANLLASDEQCATLTDGNYTVGDGTQEEEEDTTKEDTTDVQQPAVPDALPQAGATNWLRWLTSGLALVGIGLLLL